MSNRVLIFGISGFAGRHLYNALAGRQAHQLFGTFHRHLDDAVQRSVSRAELLQCDVRDYGAIALTLETVKPDQIYFLPAVVTVARSEEQAVTIYQTNLTGAALFYESARRICPTAKILAVGSAEEYGIVPKELLPIKEETPLHPISPYGISKALAEQLGMYYHRVHDLDVRFTRTFHCAGPGQPASFVTSDFARQLAAIEKGAEPRMRVGNLQAVRDFTDIRDIVEAYALLMESGQRGRVYNVCSGEGISIESILRKLLSLVQVEVRIESIADKIRRLDVPEFKGDNSCLVAETGWSRKYTLDQTVVDVLEYWRKRG